MMHEEHSGPDVALRFNHVDFSYASVPVLHNASFHIHRREFIALVGANGSGKTTALKLILGLERPKSGTVEVFGVAPEHAKNRLGFVPQQADYDKSFPISVREVVRMGRLMPHSRRYRPEDEASIKEAMVRSDILDLADRSYAALSGGQRRRVLVARALAAKPDFFILDEPTANMDGESERRLFKTLGELKGNTTILIVTHDTGFVSSLTDRVFCVADHDRRVDIAQGEGRFLGNSIVQHRTAPANNAPPDLYGGTVYTVLHDESLPGNSCCVEEGNE